LWKVEACESHAGAVVNLVVIFSTTAKRFDSILPSNIGLKFFDENHEMIYFQNNDDDIF